MAKSYGLFGITAVLLAFIMLTSAYAIQPSAPESMENISSESPAPGIGSVLNTSGGTITVVNFNATTQNPRWKGFVGNISGRFALRDSSNMTLYDWTLATVQGEIYATMNSALVDWANAACASYDEVDAEQTSLGFQIDDEDSINKTFNKTAHASFYAGDTFIDANSCPSTNLFASGQAQDSLFEEVLLYDSNIIYTALLENSEAGYSSQQYDYQMIVPDNTNQSKTSEVYYFYIELI